MEKELQKLNFEIIINASAEKVWHTMLDKETYRKWTIVFSPNGAETWYEKDTEGEFRVAEKVKFIGQDENGKLSGMLSEVSEIRPFEYISFRHFGFLFSGVEDYFSIEKNGWEATFENYTFNKLSDGKTELKVYMDSDPEYKDMFSNLWPSALLKLKEMCELASH